MMWFHFSFRNGQDYVYGKGVNSSTSEKMKQYLRRENNANKKPVVIILCDIKIYTKTHA